MRTEDSNIEHERKVKNIIGVGDQVDIEIDKLCYRTIVEDITSYGTLIVGHPTLKTKLVPFKVEQKVLVDCYLEEGLHCFDAKVIRIYEDEGRNLLELQVRSVLRKHQRRESFRLHMSLPVKVKEWSSMLKPGQKNPLFYNTRTTNISDSGMLILADHDSRMGTHMDCRLILPSEVVYLRCTVKRTLWPTSKGQPYQIGVKFIEMPIRDQQKISKFIMEKQIDFRNEIFI